MALLSWYAIQEVGYSCPCPSVAMLQLVSVTIHVLLSTHACARHHKKAQAITPRSPQEHAGQEVTWWRLQTRQGMVHNNSRLPWEKWQGWHGFRKSKRLGCVKDGCGLRRTKVSTFCATLFGGGQHRCIRRWRLTSSYMVHPKTPGTQEERYNSQPHSVPVMLSPSQFPEPPSFPVLASSLKEQSSIFCEFGHLETTSVWRAHPWKPIPCGGVCTSVLPMTGSNVQSSSATQECQIQGLEQSRSHERLPNPAHIVPVFLNSDDCFW